MPQGLTLTAGRPEKRGSVMVKVADWFLVHFNQRKAWMQAFFFSSLPQALLDNTTNDNLKSDTTLYLQDLVLTDGAVFK